MLRNIFLKIYKTDSKTLTTLVERSGRRLERRGDVVFVNYRTMFYDSLIILPKLLHRFSVFSKSHQMFYIEIEKLVQKFILECKEPRIAKTILKKKKQSWTTHIMISKKFLIKLQ